jgi:GTP-binding protein
VERLPREGLRHSTVDFVGSAASPDQFPRDGRPEIAFLGRSNVGKSRLLNALAGQRGLARVSAEPGRTRLVNFFRVAGAAGAASRWDLYLVDLPGYGYAKAPKAEREGWEKLVTSYLVGRPTLALCVFLVDARHEATEGDETLRGFLDHYGTPYVLAATKADKLGHGELARRTRELARGVGRNARAMVAVSATEGTGIDELWRTIVEAAVAAPATRN